jgi:hypothetical protein
MVQPFKTIEMDLTDIMRRHQVRIRVTNVKKVTLRIRLAIKLMKAVVFILPSDTKVFVED